MKKETLNDLLILFKNVIVRVTRFSYNFFSFYIVIKIYSYLSHCRSDEAQFLVILPNEWLHGGRIMLLCLYRRLVYQ